MKRALFTLVVTVVLVVMVCCTIHAIGHVLERAPRGEELL